MTALFPAERLFHPLSEPEEGQLISARLDELPENPLTHSQLNQLLHRSHQAGMTQGFFRFYFLDVPSRHPFAVAAPPLDLASVTRIQSMEHLRWGIDRFALDAAFFFGDFRNAYRTLRELSYEDIALFFLDRGEIDTEWMKLRGPTMPMKRIEVDNRHLVSELACKALDRPTEGDVSLAGALLSRAFRENDSRRIKLKNLVARASEIDDDAQLTAALPLVTEEVGERIVTSEDRLSTIMDDVHARFVLTRASALENTKSYLSICNELDVYVATSMRVQADFRTTGEACARIFSSAELSPLNLRWFDPTVSACDSHEDKGLIECLMVDQAQLVLHFAGERDSWGKDAEAAMALSRGKPVVVLCPDTQQGRERARIFRDVHPLSRLTDYIHGVAVGSIITNDEGTAIEVMRRFFENEMSYRLEAREHGFVVKEELTDSVVRIVTRDEMIRETFWNYYNSVP